MAAVASRAAHRGHDHNGHGNHHLRHQERYHNLHAKLNRVRSEKNKKQATPAPAPTPTPIKVTTTTNTTANTKKQTSGVSLQGLSAEPGKTQLIETKLPEVTALIAETTSKTTDFGMQRLGGPMDPKAADDKNAGALNLKKEDGRGDGDPKTLKLSRGLGAMVDRKLPPVGSFVPNEVLAIDASKAALAKAVSLKFSILEQIELKGLGYTLTRLKTPENLNAFSGVTALHQASPDEGYAVNSIYGTYRTTAGGTPSGGGANPPPALGKPQVPGNNVNQRGFASAAINWQPQLAACAREITIGVIDTGYDKNHPAFEGARIDPKTFVTGTAKPSNQHGTAVLSLLTGAARSSTPGLVPDAAYVVVDAFFADSSGNAMSNTRTMVQALDWLAQKKVDVANLSFAGPADQLVHDAIRELAKRGTVILAAAGNEGPEAPPSYPAAYSEVIAVTAVDRNLAPYAYANHGKYVAVAAPGVDVWTALPNRREGLQTGTSFAVPFVTSVVALSYPTADKRTDGDPAAPRERALALLQKNIKSMGGGRSPVFGAGLVQAPSHCDRGPPAAVANNGWGKVEVAPSVTPVVAPSVTQSGAWISTVVKSR